MLRHCIFALGAVLTISLLACGSEPEQEKNLAIFEFSVDVDDIASGETVTLHWRTRDASTIAITANGAEISLENPNPSEGMANVEVDETTTFVLEARAGGDKVLSAPLTVTVGELRILSFEASADLINLGESITLSWATAYATAASLIDGTGESIDLGDESVAQGSLSVTPTASATFTLRARAGSRTEEATVSVQVRGAPRLEAGANPQSIAWGEEVALSWLVHDGERLRIERDGELIHESELPEGEFVDTPPRTSTYLFTAMRDDLTSHVSRTVVVQPAILEFSGPEEPQPPGETVEIFWRVGGATEITLSNGAGVESTLEIDSPDEGIWSAPMGDDGVFTLVARSGESEERSELEIPVLLAPTIGTFHANRTVASAHPDETASVNLIWSGVERATELILVGDTTGPIEIAVAESGLVPVSIDADTVFTLEARNAAGSVDAQITVRVVPYPTIDQFIAVPNRVGVGGTFELSWATTGASSINLKGNGDHVPGVPQTQVSGTTSLVLTTDTSFVLRAINEANDYVEETIVVTVGSPEILAFEAVPDYVQPETEFIFEWTNLGGTSLTLVDEDDGIVCTTADPVVMQSGSCPHEIPEEGLFTFTLRLEDGLGDSTTATRTVRVSEGPHIVSFTGAESLLTVGDSLLFSWEVMNDPLGNTPVIALTDGTNAYDLTDTDPNEGSKAFPITSLGEHTFTFAAGTHLGTKQATHEATVFGIPTVSLAAAPAIYDGSDPVSFTWTSEHAASLALYLLDDQGDPIEPAIHVVPEGERAAGSFDHHPSHSGTYRLVALNGAGMPATDEAVIAFSPPIIVSFEAVPDEAVTGDPVMLNWTTRVTDEVKLSILDGVLVEEITEPFEDIRSIGVPVTMTGACGDGDFSADDEGCAAIDFPPGFTFPFGGVDRTSVFMYANGFLGFFAYTADNTYSNGALNGANTHVAIAPFWDDFDAGTAHSYFGSDAEGDYFILQWTDRKLFNTTNYLTFQVLLRPSGAFEFRYAPEASPNARKDGSSATIGYQYPDGSQIHVFSHNTAVAGGLGGRGWRYSWPTVEPNGSLEIAAPASDLDVTLTAFGPGGQSSETISITVHPRATAAISLPDEEIEAGDAFEVAWTTTNADAVIVVDQDENLRCTADAEEVEQGSCLFTEATPGTYTYFVRATGALGHVVEAQGEMQIYIPLSLDFQASDTEIEAGQSVTLSWVTTGANEISLTANGTELLTGTEPLDAGNLIHQPQEMTTYVFTVHTADGRSLTSTHEVKVRTFTFELSASATEVTPGTPVTITWNVSSLTGGTPTILGDWPLLDVSGSSAFEDISGLGQSSVIGAGFGTSTLTVDFPAGFEFPYFGESYSKVRISAPGWISFDTSAGYEYENTPLPASTTSKQKINMAVFWDDLHTQQGRVDAVHLQNPERFIIQWTNVGRWYPTDSRDYDLNFQIVLFPDGTFEYRYGTMEGALTPATDTDHCNPLSCADEANGSSATIGYQKPGGTGGYTLHYGGPSSENHPPFPGGLSNRAFRFQAPAGNSMVVSPKDPTDYTICVNLGGFDECKTVRIEAAWEIDDFTVSSESIAIGESVTLAWETTGADSLTLEANGVPVDIAGKSLDSDSIVLQPTEGTTYVLTLDSLGRTKTSERTVEVRTFEFDIDLPGDHFPNEVVELDWEVNPIGGGTPFVYRSMDEVASPFFDIRGEAGVVQLVGGGTDGTVADHSFAGGFSFPYFGEAQTSVRVSTDGYLSFDSSTSTTLSNLRLPSSDSTPRRVHIAPFWDDLHTRTSGRVHALHANDGSYIIQWSAVSKYVGSSTSIEYDLNFQVVLFPNGAFEFRYGTMTPPSTTDSSCYPSKDCSDDANGASATIGYQDPTGNMGGVIHFGGAGQAASNRPFPGGLAQRSFRMDPTQASGTFTVKAGVTEDPWICAILGGYGTCESIEVVPIVEFGSVIITELMLQPAAGEAQWFEVRNLSGAPIDLQGWEIWNGASVATINQALVIPPYGFATFALGPTTGFTPDFFIAGMVLNPAGDFLALGRNGGAVTEVSWDATWTVLAGESLELDSFAQQRENHAHTDPNRFCPRSETYDAGANHGTPGWDGGTCIAAQPYVAYHHSGAEIFDITTTGITLSTSYDTVVARALSFQFPFIGMDTANLWVSTSGYVTVNSAPSTWSNVILPSTGSQATAGLIAPFWDDWIFSRLNAIVRFEERTVNGTQVAIIDWDNMSAWSASSSDRNAFQLQLWADGRIVFAYRLIEGTNPLNFGSSGTIGIQEPTGTNPAYMLYAFNRPNSVYEGLTLEFVPIASP